MTDQEERKKLPACDFYEELIKDPSFGTVDGTIPEFEDVKFTEEELRRFRIGKRVN